MGMFDTIADLQKTAEKAKTGGGKAFLQLDAGDQIKVRFRQELAKDGKGYDEEAGTGLGVGVHAHPKDFKKKLACTIEDPEFDNRCWAHEQVLVNPKWRDTKRFLINVAVLEDGEWVNKVLDQTFSPKHVIGSLVEYAVEYGTITDRYYKMSRTGSKMNDTNYSLIPVDPTKEAEEISALELADLSTWYRKLPYDEQQEFFMTESSEKEPAGKW